MKDNKVTDKYSLDDGALDIEKILDEGQELLKLLLGASHVYLRELQEEDEAEELIKGVQRRLDELCEDVVDECGELIGPPVFTGAMALVLHQLLQEQRAESPMVLLFTKEPLDC